MPKLLKGILVSTRRNDEKSAGSEIHYALTNDLGLKSSIINISNSGISGLVTVGLKGKNPVELITQIAKLEENSNYFLHCLKFKPIEHVISMDLEELASLVDKEKTKIEGSFKIEVGKRHAKYSTQELISTVATRIDNPVNLDNPDIIVLIELLGNKLGLSIIRPDQVYSTKKANEEQAEENNWFLN